MSKIKRSDGESNEINVHESGCNKCQNGECQCNEECNHSEEPLPEIEHPEGIVSEVREMNVFPDGNGVASGAYGIVSNGMNYGITSGPISYNNDPDNDPVVCDDEDEDEDDGFDESDIEDGDDVVESMISHIEDMANEFGLTLIPIEEHDQHDSAPESQSVHPNQTEVGEILGNIYNRIMSIDTALGAMRHMQEIVVENNRQIGRLRSELQMLSGKVTGLSEQLIGHDDQVKKAIQNSSGANASSIIDAINNICYDAADDVIHETSRLIKKKMKFAKKRK